MEHFTRIISISSDYEDRLAMTNCFTFCLIRMAFVVIPIIPVNVSNVSIPLETIFDLRREKVTRSCGQIGKCADQSVHQRNLIKVFPLPIKNIYMF